MYQPDKLKAEFKKHHMQGLTVPAEFSVTGDAFLAAVVELSKVLFDEAKGIGKHKTLPQCMVEARACVSIFLSHHNISFTDHRHH